MKALHLLLPSLALGGAALLVAPPPASGFTFIGGNLSTAQRDFRIFNNFSDASANDNQVADASFPGHQGAVMSIWKAGVEWGSELHGTGGGDPHQPGGLGSGGANFDAAFGGESTSVGGTNDNIHSELGGSSGGVLAFCETPISDGWRIRYYAGWQWADGPGNPTFSQIDLQGVATHEYGHALGLGHSSAGGGPTMTSFVSGSGVSQRSLASDDIAGVQAIYGVKSGTKPRITGVSVNGSTVTISGTNFSPTNNEVWFASADPTASFTHPIVIVGGVSSSGNQIVVTAPFGSGSGDVLVKKNASGHSSLSNAWPVDVTGGGGGGFQISSIVPSTISAVNVGTDQFVTINGSGFSPTTKVRVDGDVLTGIPAPYTVVSSTRIDFAPPLMSKLGSVTVEVEDGAFSDSEQITVVANATPAVEAGSGEEPVTMFSIAPLPVALGSAPGDIVFLVASLDHVPSVLPGWFSLAIGNNFASAILLGGFAVPAKGYFETTVSTPTLPPLTKFWIQGVAVEPLLTLPLATSNTQEIQVIF